MIIKSFTNLRIRVINVVARVATGKTLNRYLQPQNKYFETWKPNSNAQYWVLVRSCCFLSMSALRSQIQEHRLVHMWALALCKQHIFANDEIWTTPHWKIFRTGRGSSLCHIQIDNIWNVGCSCWKYYSRAMIPLGRVNTVAGTDTVHCGLHAIHLYMYRTFQDLR